MYMPQHHEERDVGVLRALVRAHPLGTWATVCEGGHGVPGGSGLIVNHVPFVLDETRGEHGTLVAHVARANPVWRSFSRTVASVVAFQGAESYITPSWYASKQAHGKVVPTWNYAVVHASGLPRAIEDGAWLLDHVSRITDVHEAAQPEPWQVADAPRDYVERLIEAIVGIEIPIDALVGKWKVSQNRPRADKLGVVAGLRGRADAASGAMAALVQQHAGPAD